MDISSILFILALLILVALYVGKPLAAHRSVGVTAIEQEISTQLNEQDRILDALTELEFDHSMGKVPEEIYPMQRARLVEQGVDVLRQLDTHQQENDQMLRELGDVEIPTDDLDAMIAKRRQHSIAQPTSFCPNCGKPSQIEDRFCASCGVALS